MRAIGDKRFDGFLATSKSRLMQSSPSILILRIHPHQQIARVSTSMLPELAAPQIQINFCSDIKRDEELAESVGYHRRLIQRDGLLVWHFH